MHLLLYCIFMYFRLRRAACWQFFGRIVGIYPFRIDSVCLCARIQTECGYMGPKGLRSAATRYIKVRAARGNQPHNSCPITQAMFSGRCVCCFAGEYARTQQHSSSSTTNRATYAPVCAWRVRTITRDGGGAPKRRNRRNECLSGRYTKKYFYFVWGISSTPTQRL